jgi:hypothetical protein
MSAVRTRALLACLSIVLLGAAPSLSSEEQAALSRREVVIRSEETAQGGEVVAVVAVNAPAEKVLDAVLDLPPRADEVGPLTEVSVYKNEGDEVAAKFVISVMGSATTFHVLYDVDRAGLKTTYSLDPSKTNDIASSDGSYEVVPNGTGSHLVYRSAVTSDSWVPSWLKQKLTEGPLIEQLEGIRARAEASK